MCIRDRGTSYTTPVISSSTTYYVSPTIGGGASSVGISSTSTSCGTIASSTATDWPIRFNTTAVVTINSVDFIPNASGSLVLALRNSLSSTDIQTATFNITAAMVGVTQTLPLGFVISTPGSY